MTYIHKRALGNTGDMVTEISLGAMNLRLLDTEDEGIQVIHRALDQGINLIDTARAYKMEKPDGSLIESEVLVNKAIVGREPMNEPIFIVTKGHGYDIEAFDDHIYTSLSKLGVHYDGTLKIGKQEIKLIYFFHGITKERWETIKSSGVLDHARNKQSEGLFTYLGFSSHNGHEVCIEEAINSGYFQVTELPYNVFSPSMTSLMAQAQERGMGVINMKCFGGNGMVSKYDLFKDYCDISPSERLQFCLASPYVSTIDVGCRFVSELDEDLAVALKPKISQDQCKALMDLADKVGKSTENTCRECTHCLEKFECPKGVDFPKILALHTRYKVAEAFDKAIEPIKVQYTSYRDEALECVACGACLEWCEYKLDIPGLLEETDQLLG